MGEVRPFVRFRATRPDTGGYFINPSQVVWIAASADGETTIFCGSMAWISVAMTPEMVLYRLKGSVE